jgi:hypothetical protein
VRVAIPELARFEDGRRLATPNEARALADALFVTVEDLQREDA